LNAVVRTEIWNKDGRRVGTFQRATFVSEKLLGTVRMFKWDVSSVMYEVLYYSKVEVQRGHKK